jgi:1,4-dihydroxy-2-naphthoyl-CoA synthase
MSLNGISALGYEGGTSMDLNEIRYEVENGVATVTMNRPDKMNAVDTALRDELIRVFGEADRDDEVRAVVVTGQVRPFAQGPICPKGVPGLIIPVKKEKRSP